MTGTSNRRREQGTQGAILCGETERGVDRAAQQLLSDCLPGTDLRGEGNASFAPCRVGVVPGADGGQPPHLPTFAGAPTGAILDTVASAPTTDKLQEEEW